MPSRASAWLQLIAGWIPVWALYTAIIVTMHGPVPLPHAAFVALRAVAPAALLGIMVHRLAARLPWPNPFQWKFVAMHLFASLAYSLAWLLAASIVESLWRFKPVLAVGSTVAPFLMLGIWLYASVASVSYALESTRRVALAEGTAARSQLAALRAQLHPHFLFNVLHSVVQLIPRQPAQAVETAERVADLLRVTIQEDRDLVSLDDEWVFVTKYLALEHLRFGDRLRIESDIDADVLEALVPSFVMQTLVENAVRHGASHRERATTITIGAHAVRRERHLAVRIEVTDVGVGEQSTSHRDSDDSDDSVDVSRSAGSGLVRLRERLAALYGEGATLVSGPHSDGWRSVVEFPEARDGSRVRVRAE